METLDSQYRAFLEFCKAEESQTTKNLKKSIQLANVEEDVIDVISYTFNIDRTWIIEIEKGLEFVQKALEEERQFIRSNGEVVPIEKAKRVSKASVSHLARHSNLITRKVEGEDLIPDKIYTVEKLSDYSVYENRFLYMLLCYLRDFITIRFDKIIEYTNSYSGKLNIEKNISSRYSNMNVKIHFEENKKNDYYAKIKNSQQDLIDRIDILLKTVMIFLQTPLMNEVSKSPMLKPPIVKTNVLKMNKNFKGAVALYDFVTSYTEDGYEIKEIHKKINPFDDRTSEEYSSVIALISFLTYKNGNDIDKELKKRYENYISSKKLEDIEDLNNKINRLKKKVSKGEIQIENYVIELEKEIKKLTIEVKQSLKTKEENNQLKEKIIDLEFIIQNLEEELENTKTLLSQKEQEILDLIEKHKQEINELKEAYENQIAKLKEEYQQEIDRLNEEYTNKINELIENYENQIIALKTDYENQIKELTERFEKEKQELISSHEQELSSLKEKHIQEIDSLNESHAQEIKELKESHIQEVDALNNKYKVDTTLLKENLESSTNSLEIAEDRISNLEANDQLIDQETQVLKAEINTLREQLGQEEISDDFTSEERFKELEVELETFKKIFKSSWQKTKKEIRRKVKDEYQYKIHKNKKD